jgi:hypothetical protein
VAVQEITRGDGRYKGYWVRFSTLADLADRCVPWGARAVGRYLHSARKL